MLAGEFAPVMFSKMCGVDLRPRPFRRRADRPDLGCQDERHHHPRRSQGEGWAGPCGLSCAGRYRLRRISVVVPGWMPARNSVSSRWGLTAPPRSGVMNEREIADFAAARTIGAAPFRLAIILVPGFALMSFASVIEPARAANRMSRAQALSMAPVRHRRAAASNPTAASRSPPAPVSGT